MKDKINSTDDLNAYVGDTEERLKEIEHANELLTNKVKSINTLVKGNVYKDLNGDDEDKVNARWGQLARALRLAEKGALSDGEKELVQKVLIEPGEKKALLGTPLTSDSTTGSYTIATEYWNDIEHTAAKESEIIPKLKTVPMANLTMKVPVKSTGLSFTYVTSQGTAYTEQNPTFDQKTMTAYTFALWISVVEEFLEDDIATSGAYFKEQAAEAYQKLIETEMLIGTSPFTGWATAASVNQQILGSDSIDNIGSDDLYNLVEELTTQAKRRNSAFIMHPLIYDKIRMLKNANGDYLIRPLEESMSRRLFGYDVLLSDYANSTDAASTVFVHFGNLQKVWLGVRKGFEAKFFGETAKAAQYGEVFFRFRCRLGLLFPEPANLSRLITAA